MSTMKPYMDLVRELYEFDSPRVERRSNRTGIDTIGVFGHVLEFDLRQGFPLLTERRLHVKSIVQELLWFLRGETNTKSLRENGVTIWDEWADENGELGPVYGKQWRRWNSPDHIQVDQVQILVNELRDNPGSRRHVVSAWNAGELHRMALPPCHMLWQCYVAGEGQNKRLDLQMYQRSADVFLGLPFNIASYALLQSMLAHVTGMKPRFLRIVIGDAHLYVNHLNQARELLHREPHRAPLLLLNPSVRDIDQFKAEDIVFDAYDAGPPIKADVAV